MSDDGFQDIDHMAAIEVVLLHIHPSHIEQVESLVAVSLEIFVHIFLDFGISIHHIVELLIVGTEDG